MQPEDRLDALLTSRRARGDSALAGGRGGDLSPLLDAADRLAPLASARPGTDFAQALESRLLKHGNQLAGLRSGVIATSPDKAQTKTLEPTIVSGRSRSVRTRVPGSRLRRPQLLWPAIAAALFITVLGGTLTAAAHAGPGTPLFGMREWEQSVQISLASSPADRVRLHLSYANDALTALDGVVARRGGDPSYSDALTALQREVSAAASDLSAVASPAEHDALAQQLSGFRSHERQDLHTALAVLPWPDRVATTSALAHAGDNNVPVVVSVAIAPTGDGEARDVKITVIGTGFQKGAVLLIDGVVMGQVAEVSPTTLVAQATQDEVGRGHRTIGIGNPDGTAAVASQPSEGGRPESSPGSEKTPSPSEGHGNSGHGDGSATPTPVDGRGGDQRGTPAPTQIPGPGDH